jgi:DNA primase large subunit
MQVELLGKYPFIEEAKSYLEEKEYSITPKLIEESLKRVNNDLSQKSFSYSGEEGILTYAIARSLVSATNSNYIISRFAINEAKNFIELLSKEENQVVVEISQKLGIKVEIFANEWVINLVSYLANMPKSQEYKLVNQSVRIGNVYLTRNKFIRFLEEAIRNKVYSGLPIKKESIPKDIIEASKKIEVKIESKEVKISKTNIAPCMQRLIQRLKRSENLSHQERWILVVYLCKIGVSKEEVKQLFKFAPDYNEKITNYQVEYLYKKQYMVPNCSVLRTYGICIQECGVKNPLSFKKKIKTTEANS